MPVYSSTIACNVSRSARNISISFSNFEILSIASLYFLSNSIYWANNFEFLSTWTATDLVNKYGYEKTKKLLTENKKLLDLIANTLLEEETITKEQIDYLVEHGHLPKEETVSTEEEAETNKKNTTKKEEKTKKETKKQVEGQFDLFDVKFADISRELDKININELTPIEALNTLVKLKDMIK